MNSVDFRLDGKAALITGAARGIGLAIGKTLAQHGCAVAIQDIDADAAQEAIAAITAGGGRAVAIIGDLRDEQSAPAWVDQTAAAFGRFDILINNGAIQSQADFLQITSGDLLEKYRANFVVPVLLCQRAVPLMEKAGGGRIINLGSVQQIRGNVGMLGYSVTKMAMTHLTTATARWLAKKKITINTISPGWFNTYRNRNDFPNEQELQQRGQHLPLGRVGQPMDCAGAALLLCSPAGEYITGQTLFIDGGISS